MSFRIRVTDTQGQRYWLSPGTIFPKLNPVGGHVPVEAEFETRQAAMAFLACLRPDLWASELSDSKVKLVRGRTQCLEVTETYTVIAASYPIHDPDYVWETDFRRHRPSSLEHDEGAPHQTTVATVLEFLMLAEKQSPEFQNTLWNMIQEKCYADAGWGAAAQLWILRGTTTETEE